MTDQPLLFLERLFRDLLCRPSMGEGHFALIEATAQFTQRNPKAASAA